MRRSHSTNVSHLAPLPGPEQNANDRQHGLAWAIDYSPNRFIATSHTAIGNHHDHRSNQPGYPLGVGLNYPHSSPIELPVLFMNFHVLNRKIILVPIPVIITGQDILKLMKSHLVVLIYFKVNRAEPLARACSVLLPQ